MYGLKDPTFGQRSLQQFIVTFHRSDKYDPEVWYRRKVESKAVEAAARHTIIDILIEDEAMVYNAILKGKGNTMDDISKSTGLSPFTIQDQANRFEIEGNESCRQRRQQTQRKVCHHPSELPAIRLN